MSTLYLLDTALAPSLADLPIPPNVFTLENRSTGGRGRSKGSKNRAESRSVCGKVRHSGADSFLLKLYLSPKSQEALEAGLWLFWAVGATHRHPCSVGQREVHRGWEEGESRCLGIRSTCIRISELSPDTCLGVSLHIGDLFFPFEKQNIREGTFDLSLGSLPSLLLSVTSIPYVLGWNKAYRILCPSKYAQARTARAPLQPHTSTTTTTLVCRVRARAPRLWEVAWTNCSLASAPESPKLPWFLFFLKPVWMFL